jgi:hypothetical protein
MKDELMDLTVPGDNLGKYIFHEQKYQLKETLFPTGL